MIRILGGEDALNLDGGGSSTLWSGALPYKGIANTPSGSAERKVCLLYTSINRRQALLHKPADYRK